jgi:methionyl-tRNA synthetase
LNQAIDHTEPWKFIKDGRISDLHYLLSKWVKTLYQIGYWLKPFLPEIGARIIEILRQKRIAKCAPILPRIKI